MLTLLWALVPSVGCLWLFWLAMRAILQADRRERAALARIEAEQDRADRERRAAVPAGEAGPSSAAEADGGTPAGPPVP